MSTRRARIKAVAALPPRRKNADPKNSQSVLKEGYEKGPPTPKTPRVYSGKKDELKSPIPNTDNKSPVAKAIRTPPPLIPISTAKTHIENISSPRQETPKGHVPANNTPQIEKEKFDAPQSEKVSVITSASNSNDLLTNNPLTKITPDKRPSLKSVSSPKVNIVCQNRNGIEKTSGTDCNIENVQAPNIQNVQANHIQNLQETKRKTIEDSDKQNGIDKIVDTPSVSEREKRSDIPDGKFLTCRIWLKHKLA